MINEIYENFTRPERKVESVDLPEDMRYLLQSIPDIFRLSNDLSDNVRKKLVLFLCRLRRIIIGSCLEYEDHRDSLLENYGELRLTQFPQLEELWADLRPRLIEGFSKATPNNKRNKLIEMLTNVTEGEGVALILPNTQSMTEDQFRNDLETMESLPSIPSLIRNRSILMKGMWNKVICLSGYVTDDDRLMRAVMLSGHCSNVIQINYRNLGYDKPLHQRFSAQPLPFDSKTYYSRPTQLRKVQEQQDSQADTSMDEWLQEKVWGILRGRYIQNDGETPSDYEARLVRLTGNYVVPLRYDGKIPCCRENEETGYASVESIAVMDIERSDKIILPTELYIEQRNTMADEQLKESEHGDFREKTDRWKELLRRALDDWTCQLFAEGLFEESHIEIKPPSYLLKYISDEVMQPQQFERFRDIMNYALYLMDMTSEKTKVEDWWEATRKLKSARTAEAKVLESICKDCVSELDAHRLAQNPCPVEYKGHELWNIWQIEDIDPGRIKITYYHLNQVEKY